MVNKPYKIITSQFEVQIDGDELEKALKAIEDGSMIATKKGIINPSFVVGIVPDEDRMREHMREVKLLEHPDNEKEREKLLIEGCPRLKDSFQELVKGMKALPEKHE